MFEYEKDKYELMAEAEGEKAFAEVIKVAEEFARQIDSQYHRRVTDWAVYSNFDSFWWSDGNWFDGEYHHVKFRKRVDIDVAPYEHSEAVECAWELEASWNESVDKWDGIEEQIDGLLLSRMDCDAEALEDVLDKMHDKALDSMADVVERWLDSVECWYWSSDYADELREEEVA